MSGEFFSRISFDNYESGMTEPEEPVQRRVGPKRPWGQ